MPEKIVGFEGSPVNLTFYLDSRQCPNQTDYTIIIARDDNGRHTHVCKFHMFNKCEVSRNSVGCFCLSYFGPMLFTTNVTNKTYIWKWGDTTPLEERRVTLRIDSEFRCLTIISRKKVHLNMLSHYIQMFLLFDFQLQRAFLYVQCVWKLCVCLHLCPTTGVTRGRSSSHVFSFRAPQKKTQDIGNKLKTNIGLRGFFTSSPKLQSPRFMALTKRLSQD